MKLRTTIGGSLLLAPSFLCAGLIEFAGYRVTVEGTVGSGPNQAIVFFDWGSGSTPSHSWLYQWDASNPTLGDAFDDIELSTAGDFDWDSQAFSTQMDYDDGAEQHAGSAAGWMSFWNSSTSDGFSVTGTNSSGLVLFTNPQGVKDEPLLNNEWYGAHPDTEAYGASTWPGPAPEVLAVAVPEPAIGALMVMGLLGLCTLRRKFIKE